MCGSFELFTEQLFKIRIFSYFTFPLIYANPCVMFLDKHYISTFLPYFQCQQLETLGNIFVKCIEKQDLYCSKLHIFFQVAIPLKVIFFIMESASENHIHKEATGNPMYFFYFFFCFMCFSPQKILNWWIYLSLQFCVWSDHKHSLMLATPLCSDLFKLLVCQDQF